MRRAALSILVITRQPVADEAFPGVARAVARRNQLADEGGDGRFVVAELHPVPPEVELGDGDGDWPLR